jgi:hypothetical protein
LSLSAFTQGQIMSGLSNFQACSESWDGMERLGDGRRFCGRCERPVTDLRGRSIAEITFVHLMSDGPLCGVYTPDQLRAPEPAKRCRSSSLVTLALGASLLAAHAEAQASTPHPREQVQLPPGAAPHPDDTIQPPDAAPAGDTLRIHGRVRGEDGRPLGEAVVVVDGTPVRTITDSAGGFILRLPERIWGEIRLLVARLGYEMRTVVLADPEAAGEIDLQLEPAPVALAGLVLPSSSRGQEREAERTQKRREGSSVARITPSDP